MASQAYYGFTTIAGVPGVASVSGVAVFDLAAMSVSDSFQVAEQIDVDGDVVRVTPWRQQRNVLITFYPTMADPSQLDLPVPMSKVTVFNRPELPLPKVFWGEWRYVGPGELSTANNNLMVMRLNIRKWNPLYGQTIVPS